MQAASQRLSGVLALWLSRPPPPVRADSSPGCLRDLRGAAEARRRRSGKH